MRKREYSIKIPEINKPPKSYSERDNPAEWLFIGNKAEEMLIKLYLKHKKVKNINEI